MHAQTRRTAELYGLEDRGLLAPGLDYETPPPYLEAIADSMDERGFVHLPEGPGMGYRIIWDYINDHRLKRE